MNIQLRPRTEQDVIVYFHKTDDPEIESMLPRSVAKLEQALENYHKSLLPGAASFGRTIWVEGKYVGDVWCHCMEPGGDPEAMVSFCLFEKDCWGRGLMTQALGLFVEEVREKFSLATLGAFCFAANQASRRVLEKNGFRLVENFTEDGVASCYFEKRM